METGLVLGIDPGTSRWAFTFMEQGRVVRERIVDTKTIREQPGLATKISKRAKIVVGPSGYGTSIKRVSELTQHDFFEILLKRGGESIVGVEAVLREFIRENINAYVVPGVKLLPTVPIEKKRGRVDMGTPDKLCAAIAGIVEQTRRRRIHYSEASLILAEFGHAFDAFVSVAEGRIVDGIGGSMSRSSGFSIDGEILYLKGKIEKGEVGRKEEADITKDAITDIQTLLSENPGAEILVSGTRSRKIFPELRKRLQNVRLLQIGSSNAAYGAAVIGDGLSGGSFSDLVELLEIRKAGGSNLDYVDL